MNIIISEYLEGTNPNLSAGNRAIACRSVSNYQFVTITHNAEFYSINNKPFSIYIRYLDLGNNNDFGYGPYTGLVSKASNGHGWSLAIKNSKPEFTFSKYGGYTGVRDNRVILPSEFWRSILVMGTPSEQNTYNFRVFINGVEDSQALERFGTIPENFDDFNSNPVEVGGYNFQFLRGYIDCVAFYTTILTDAEIVSMDNYLTRTDREAKFILDFNQLTASKITSDTFAIPDRTSIRQTITAKMQEEDANGKGFIKTKGIRIFSADSILGDPMNGNFTVTEDVKINGISKYDSDITDVQYSLDNINWVPISFDISNMSTNIDLVLNESTPTLYLKATNTNPNYLNALEIHY